MKQSWKSALPMLFLSTFCHAGLEIGSITTIQPANAFYSDVRTAINDAGSAAVIWNASSNELIQSNVYRNGAWGSPATVFNVGGGDFLQQSFVSVDQNGNSIATVTANQSGSNSIVASTLPANSSTWSLGTGLSIGTGAQGQFSNVVSGPAGTTSLGTIAIWRNQTTSALTSTTLTDVVSNTWDAFVQVVSPISDSFDAGQQYLFMDRTGLPFVAFNNTSSGNRMTVSKYTGSAWSTFPDFAAGQDDYGRMAFNASNNAILLYYQGGGPFDVISSGYTAGAANWQSPLTVQTATSPLGNPPWGVGGIDAQGNAVAIWVGDTGGNNFLYFSKLPAGSSTWSAAQIFTDPSVTVLASNQSPPYFAMNSQGDAVAVWVQDDGVGRSTHLGYLPAGSSTWQLQQLSVGAVDSQTNSLSFAVNNNGQFIVAWAFSDTTTSVQAVFGQLTSNPVPPTPSGGTRTPDSFSPAFRTFDPTKPKGGLFQ